MNTMVSKKHIVRKYQSKIIINKMVAKEYALKKKELISLSKEVEELESALKDELSLYLSSNNKSLVSNGISALFVGGSVRKSIDSELLLKKYPEVYKDCLIEKESKSYIKLSV